MDKSIGRWIKIGVALAALAALALFLYSIGGLVKLLIVSALLAYVIDPAASLRPRS